MKTLQRGAFTICIFAFIVILITAMMAVKTLRRGEHMLRILSIMITVTLVMMITVKTLRRGEAARGEVSAPRLVTLHCPSHANTATTLLVLLVLSILSVLLIL